MYLSSVPNSRKNSIHNLPTPDRNPFATPHLSRTHTEDERQRASYFPSGDEPVSRRRKFKSARLRDGVYEKPWTQEKNPKAKFERIIFWSCVGIGLLLGCLICYLSYASVSNFEYCLILEDDFKTIDKQTWNYEIQRGGFGSGSFEWTTDDPQNAYVDNMGLHIVPTLTTNSTKITPAQINDGYVLNLTTAGTCTSKSINDCSIRSNKTSGSIINPVRSARLNTKGKKTITYGRVEVVAKMPKGDWLWPAIWMMPQTDVYGPWPARFVIP